ncbi:hypothetical protein ATCC90586_002123 [Pythium insidiosum]|nr:hypothetical protein ATCC90586_002123 [Pythium insidiosum]
MDVTETAPEASLLGSVRTGAASRCDFKLSCRVNDTAISSPHSCFILGDNHLAHFFATGRFLGRALLEGNVTGFHLALPLLKIILGQPVSLSDLEFFDPETYRNLVWLLEHDSVDALGLDFIVWEQLTTADGSTQTVVVDLIPNGRDVEVALIDLRQQHPVVNTSCLLAYTAQ